MPDYSDYDLLNPSKKQRKQFKPGATMGAAAPGPSIDQMLGTPNTSKDKPLAPQGASAAAAAPLMQHYAQPGPGPGGHKDEDMYPSEDEQEQLSDERVAIWVLDRLKGGNVNPASVCTEVYVRGLGNYGVCHQVIAALQRQPAPIHLLLRQGCKTPNGEWRLPCPTHILCAQLKSASGKPFCTVPGLNDGAAKDQGTCACGPAPGQAQKKPEDKPNGCYCH